MTDPKIVTAQPHLLQSAPGTGNDRMATVRVPDRVSVLHHVSAPRQGLEAQFAERGHEIVTAAAARVFVGGRVELRGQERMEPLGSCNLPWSWPFLACPGRPAAPEFSVEPNLPNRHSARHLSLNPVNGKSSRQLQERAVG
jgi:hypothetical protein